MLDILRPFFQGPWQPYGESLVLAESNRTGPSVAEWLSEPARLDRILARHARHLGTISAPRAVASDWSIHYIATLLPPVVVATSLTGRCLPVGWHQMALRLDARGLPAAFAIQHLGTPCEHVNAAARYESLVWQHLEPLIGHLGKASRIPARILWGNVHRTLGNIFDQATQLLSHNSSLLRTLATDRQQLLTARTWPDRQLNPLALRQRAVLAATQDNTPQLVLHATCCLAYRLPHTSYCGACPLAPAHRRRKERLSPVNAVEVEP